MCRCRASNSRAWVSGASGERDDGITAAASSCSAIQNTPCRCRPWGTAGAIFAARSSQSSSWRVSIWTKSACRRRLAALPMQFPRREKTWHPHPLFDFAGRGKRNCRVGRAAASPTIGYSLILVGLAALGPPYSSFILQGGAEMIGRPGTRHFDEQALGAETAAQAVARRVKAVAASARHQKRPVENHHFRPARQRGGQQPKLSPRIGQRLQGLLQFVQFTSGGGVRGATLVGLATLGRKVMRAGVSRRQCRGIGAVAPTSTVSPSTPRRLQ